MIVIPCFNAAKDLRRSLESCVTQTTAADVLVIDNRSTDSSYEVASEFAATYENVSAIQNTENLGRVGNWNAGLDAFEASDCEHIVFLFTGDELLPGCVESLEEHFGRDELIGVVVWPHEFVLENGHVEVVRRYDHARVLAAHEALVENIKEGSILGALVGNAYSRRAVRNNRFRVDAMGKAEFDIKVSYGFKIAFLDRVLGRFHKESHRTFEKSTHSHSLPYEVALASALALEEYSNELSEYERREIARTVLLRTVERQVAVNGPSSIPALVQKLVSSGSESAARAVARKILRKG